MHGFYQVARHDLVDRYLGTQCHSCASNAHSVSFHSRVARILKLLRHCISRKRRLPFIARKLEPRVFKDAGTSIDHNTVGRIFEAVLWIKKAKHNGFGINLHELSLWCLLVDVVLNKLATVTKNVMPGWGAIL